MTQRRRVQSWKQAKVTMNEKPKRKPAAKFPTRPELKALIVRKGEHA